MRSQLEWRAGRWKYDVVDGSGRGDGHHWRVADHIGSSFTTALIGGQLWDWGNNSNGELGANLTSKYSDVPVQVVGLSGVVVFGAGGNSGSTGHQLAATSSGTLWGWGDDSYGQLGDGKSKKKVASPVKAKLLSAALGNNSVTGLALGAATPSSSTTPELCTPSARTPADHWVMAARRAPRHRSSSTAPSRWCHRRRTTPLTSTHDGSMSSTP